MMTKDMFGLATAFLILAGVTYGIANAGGVSSIAKQLGDSFGSLIQVSTQKSPTLG